MNEEALDIVMANRERYSEKLIVIDPDLQIQSGAYINSSSNNNEPRIIY